VLVLLLAQPAHPRASGRLSKIKHSWRPMLSAVDTQRLCDFLLLRPYAL